MYYRSIKRKEKDLKISEQVVSLVENVRIKLPNSGHRMLYTLLYSDLKSLGVGRDKLLQILKANHLDIKPKRAYHVTTDSDHRFKTYPDLVDGLEITRPEQVMVADITYVGTRDNPWYLALITDAYSKKIMGYDLSRSLDKQGAIRALKMAIKQREYKGEKLIHHSDRGVQYCSKAYQKLLRKAKIITSMTETYDPYKNAIAERINRTIKHDFNLSKYVNYEIVFEAYLKECIKTYNLVRPHMSCYMKTPIQMHKTRGKRRRTYQKVKVKAT